MTFDLWLQHNQNRPYIDILKSALPGPEFESCSNSAAQPLDVLLFLCLDQYRRLGELETIVHRMKIKLQEAQEKP
jgi:hypothetical protein